MMQLARKRGAVTDDFDLSRRVFLELGAMGAAGLLAAAPGSARAESRRSQGMPAMADMHAGMEAHDDGELLPPTASDWPPMPPDAPKDDDAYHQFRIAVSIHEHELVPGIRIHTLAFNDSVPGPLLRVPEGEWVKVDFENRTTLFHTIHWHGMMVPYAMDGVPLVTQPPVSPFRSYTYRFRALPYGTHFYHCHWGAVMHIQSGMYGGLIVESEDDPIQKRYGYDREQTLILSAIDTDYVRDQLNAMIARMAQRMRLMSKGRLTKWQTTQFESVDDLLRTMEEGFVPPYKRSMSGRGGLPNPDYFTINGKCYPVTPNLAIKKGERLRVRLVGAGMLEHYMHLHGHDFDIVCDDGAPLPYPIRCNTVRVGPGKTVDIIIEGNNPGIWVFHDHDTTRTTNNGHYPGGCLTKLVYEGFDPAPFTPSFRLDE